MSVVAVLPQGLESAGGDELSSLGAHAIRPGRRATSFEADMACLYRLHLQARLPFRLLREMARFPCQGRDDLYDGIQHAMDWERWLHPSMTFRVDVTGSAPGLNHSHYSALQVKNALVDQQRELWGERSSVDLDDPTPPCRCTLAEAMPCSASTAAAAACTAAATGPPWVRLH